MKIASVISGQIANLFQKRGEVDPPALIKALEREVVKQKTQVEGFYVVPNDYTIYLCEEDCHRLSAARVIKALYEAVERKVIRENCFMDGTLAVRIEKMFGGEDAVVVKSNYVEEKKSAEDTINLETDVLGNTMIQSAEDNSDATIVANKTRIISTMKSFLPKQIEYNLAVITDAKNGEIVLGEKQIYIGRKDTNDFILSDEGASRIHAYISYERHRHILCDAGSLNGTFVNKKQITRRELNHDDKILIGSTILIYKVL